MLLAADNVIVEGGVFADNDRCIDVDLGSSRMVIRNLKCTIASDHFRERKGEDYCGGTGPHASSISNCIGEKGVAMVMEGEVHWLPGP